jgi:hypothetical protein
MNIIKEVHLHPDSFKEVVDKILEFPQVTEELDPKAKFIGNAKVPPGLVILLNSSREIHGTLALTDINEQEEDDRLGSLEVVN